jgi:serralysin
MVINYAPGTYTVTGFTILGNGGNAATASGYVVHRSTVMGGAKIQASGSPFNQIIAIQDNYIVLDGFEVDGNNNIAWGSGIDTGTPSGGPGHHIWVMNCTVHGCGLSGIQLNNTEYFKVLQNYCYNNSSSNTSGLFGSGISIYEPAVIAAYVPTEQDAWYPVPIVIEGNICWNNFNNQSGTGNTDGNGIIIDDWQWTQNAPNIPYLGGGLVRGNLCYHNGSKGIQCFVSDNVTIVNNTCYDNNWDLHQIATWRGDINVQGCGGIVCYNNIAYCVVGSAIAANNTPFLMQQSAGTANVFAGNISFGAANNVGAPDTYPTTGTLANKAATDPMLKAVLGGNFYPWPSSPAFGWGKPGGGGVSPLPSTTGVFQSSS